MKTPVIIDCDPGHDDAIALVMAFASKELDVLAVTTTAGNQTLAKTTANACKVLTLIEKQVPVAMGANNPMARELEVAPAVHGDSGLDGPVLPEPAFEPVDEPSWELCRRLILESKTPVTMVATGPLTNLGILFTKYPEVKDNIERISIMGGGIDHGNWTTAAEFNILVDPEAADIVFTSGIPVIMSGLDVTEKALIKKEEVEEIRAMGQTVPVFVAELLDFFFKFHIEMGFDGAPLHDPCAVAYLMAPELFETVDYHVIIETEGKYTTGMTIADKRINPDIEKPNAKVCMGLNRKKFIDLLKDVCRSYNIEA
ncbi:MAG: nucleoside hydrolase [Spirochaetales bacterium]|nr:nucleoside hydrolase [Spirochaetales bacterium]